MRDFERLEELSSTVQSGLKANGVIWAIDQALAGAELDQEAMDSLAAGRDILLSLADPEAQESEGPRQSQKMLGTDHVRSVRHMVVLAAKLEGEAGAAEQVDVSGVLSKLAAALDAVSAKQEVEVDEEALEISLQVFATISEVRLGQGNGIVRAHKEQAPWMARTMTSPSC